MTAILVDVHHYTHTCPAGPEPHPYDTRRTVIAVNPGGPCRRPVSLRTGHTTVTIACGRRIPREQQCPACRITLIEHTMTFTHTGPHQQATQPMPGGLAAHPCTSCGQPLAAVLAELGRHLLCQPRRTRQHPTDHGVAA
ncbi:hypothetical protein [Krasilnikovia sp. MM14-A1004]|uniref:hypothetical protein n=1 Tax=Krasilnikovia sp. MM14-A1004 TaxID=3373541 RepID=UPI00399CE28F